MSAIPPAYVPQFDAPFRLLPSGQVATVEQDTPEDVGACVYNIVVCPRGAKLNDPDFGIPSPLFQTLPVQVAPIVEAINALEPRAAASAHAANSARVLELLETALFPSSDLFPGEAHPGQQRGVATTALSGEVTVNVTAQVREP